MTPDEMGQLAKLITEHGLPPSWDQWGLLIAIQFLVLVVSAYVGAHFGKRGEIDAIRTRLNEVINQQKALTTATATINSNIARRDWLDQRKWEVKQKFHWDLLMTIDQLANRWSFAASYRKAADTATDVKRKADLYEKSSSFSDEALALGDKLNRLAAVAGVIVSPSVDDAIKEYISDAVKDISARGAAYMTQHADAARSLYVKCKRAAQDDLQLSAHSVDSALELQKASGNGDEA